MAQNAEGWQYTQGKVENGETQQSMKKWEVKKAPGTSKHKGNVETKSNCAVGSEDV